MINKDEEGLAQLLDKYLTDEGFDFIRLLDDDFLDAIRLLWEKLHYIPALKLLFIMLDTLAFVEFGDDQNVFVKFMDRYFDLSHVNVTSLELWELRNGLLHTTNPDSRKVRQKKVSRLVFMIAPSEHDLPLQTTSIGKSFHVGRFFKQVMPVGIVNWIQTVNVEKRMFEVTKRYSNVVLSWNKTFVAYEPPKS